MAPSMRVRVGKIVHAMPTQNQPCRRFCPPTIDSAKRLSWVMTVHLFGIPARDYLRGKFVRITLARLLVGTCAVAFSVGVLIEHAQAQSSYVPPPTPLPPPVFNPSNPYTLPQPTYRSISPATRSTVPDYQVTLPPDDGSARTAVRSHSRPTVRVAPEAHSSDYAPFGYGYGCAWQRSWDGFWFRTSPCS